MRPRHFIQQWIGLLLDYDAAHGPDLVRTLSAYLESGGSHNATAQESSFTAARCATASSGSASSPTLTSPNPDTRVNLQVATRAWRMIDGLA